MGQQIIERSQMIEPKVPTASFWIYGLIFVLYFLVCWPLSAYAARLENAGWGDHAKVRGGMTPWHRRRRVRPMVMDGV